MHDTHTYRAGKRIWLLLGLLALVALVAAGCEDPPPTATFSSDVDLIPEAELPPGLELASPVNADVAISGPDLRGTCPGAIITVEWNGGAQFADCDAEINCKWHSLEFDPAPAGGTGGFDEVGPESMAGSMTIRMPGRNADGSTPFSPEFTATYRVWIPGSFSAIDSATVNENGTGSTVPGFEGESVEVTSMWECAPAADGSGTVWRLNYEQPDDLPACMIAQNACAVEVDTTVSAGGEGGFSRDYAAGACDTIEEGTFDTFGWGYHPGDLTYDTTDPAYAAAIGSPCTPGDPPPTGPGGEALDPPGFRLNVRCAAPRAFDTLEGAQACEDALNGLFTLLPGIELELDPIIPGIEPLPSICNLDTTCGNGVCNETCENADNCADDCSLVPLSGTLCGDGVVAGDEQCEEDNQCAVGFFCGNPDTQAPCQCVALSSEPPPESGAASEYFAVYDCFEVSPSVFEWHGAQVVLGPNGEHLQVTYVDGPHQGPWQPFCPAPAGGGGAVCGDGVCAESEKGCGVCSADCGPC